jgi:hypothetical protein
MKPSDFPFQPVPGASNTTNLAVTASSQQLTLPTPMANGPQTIMLTVIGIQDVFFAMGSVTASLTTSMPLLAGTTRAFTLPDGVTQISVIAANTGSTIYATLGTGI